MTIQNQNMGEQPIFTCKAHVFHIDPKTKRSWIAASAAAVNVSFFYDSSRGLYRIISVEGTKAVINSTITPNMTFTKTSQKFGQWSDVRANTVYGLGFASEIELNKFIEKFNEVKEATRNTPASAAKQPSSGAANGGTPTTSASASPITTRGGGGGGGGGGSGQQMVDGPPPDVMVASTSSMGGQNQNEMNSSILKVSGPSVHQRAQSLQQAVGQPTESPKKVMMDKGPNQQLSGEAQLKYENDRLKLALAQSSANAKKWEVELATLKNNNARLTSALQESTANVEEWKRQLHSYKEENTRLKVGLIELEAGRGNCDFNAMTEFRNLKTRIEELESDLRDRDDEVKILKEQALQQQSNQMSNGADSGSGDNGYKMENDTLRKTQSQLQSQLDASLDAQDQQRKVLEAINRQFGDHLSQLGQLQNELTAVLNT